LRLCGFPEFPSDEAAVKFTFSIGPGNVTTATFNAIAETEAKSPADSEIPETHEQLVGTQNRITHDLSYRAPYKALALDLLMPLPKVVHG